MGGQSSRENGIDVIDSYYKNSNIKNALVKNDRSNHVAFTEVFGSNVSNMCKLLIPIHLKKKAIDNLNTFISFMSMFGDSSKDEVALLNDLLKVLVSQSNSELFITLLDAISNNFKIKAISLFSSTAEYKKLLNKFSDNVVNDTNLFKELWNMPSTTDQLRMVLVLYKFDMIYMDMAYRSIEYFDAKLNIIGDKKINVKNLPYSGTLTGFTNDQWNDDDVANLEALFTFLITSPDLVKTGGNPNAELCYVHIILLILLLVCMVFMDDLPGLFITIIAGMSLFLGLYMFSR